jgi:hypothetical protein
MELCNRQAEILFFIFLSLVSILAFIFQKLDFQGVITTIIGDGIIAGLVYLLLTRSQGVKDVIEALETMIKREKKNRRILAELKNWMNEVKFATIWYKNGKLEVTPYNEPNPPFLKETLNVLEKYGANNLLETGQKTSEELINQGKQEINNFHKIMENEIKNKVPLDKIEFEEPLSSLQIIYDVVYKQITESGMRTLMIFHDPSNIPISDEEAESHEKGRLTHGTTTLARGEIQFLSSVKQMLENMIQNNDIQTNIDNYRNIVIELRNPLDDFQTKMNYIIDQFKHEKEL